MDRCYFCRGRVTARKVDHLHRWGEAMLLVKGLPAEVCEECKEVYSCAAGQGHLGRDHRRHDSVVQVGEGTGRQRPRVLGSEVTD